MTTYIVQYEVEFYDGPSENDTVEVDAYDAVDAMRKFDDNHELTDEILNHYHEAMCVTANAAWLA